MTAPLSLDGLTKRFGDLLAVDDLSVTIEPACVVGFLGPNGAGKTTTLRMTLGLVTPTAGSARIHGLAYHELTDPRRVVGAVLESTGAHPGRKARDHLRIEAMTADIPSTRVEDVLELVGLTDAAGRRVGEFSLGMRQRLALATALLGDPEILILDEPTNGLDPEGVHWLRSLLRGFADDGRTVLVSSHLLAEVSQSVDSVIIVDHGRLVTHTALADLNRQRVVRVRSPRATDLAAALTGPGVQVRLVDPGLIEVTGATNEQIGLVAAERGIPIFEASSESFDLESIFLRLTGAGQRVAS
jgi:ABC-2 type transport system ATP-binding protein